jgi:hypothetical protein
MERIDWVMAALLLVVLGSLAAFWTIVFFHIDDLLLAIQAVLR